jgi:hypothetical protein
VGGHGVAARGGRSGEKGYAARLHAAHGCAQRGTEECEELLGLLSAMPGFRRLMGPVDAAAGEGAPPP